MKYDEIKHIEFELTTACNAWCPGCVRYIRTDAGLYKNGNVEFNRYITLDTIDNILIEDCIADDVTILLCGTAGDPLTHPDFLEIIKRIKTHKPNCEFNIHTNAGLRTPEFFKELASILNEQDSIKFNIDGLEDTNWIYRRRVDFNKIMENAKAFLENHKCISVWELIEFPWNRHQIEQAQHLAKQMGFKKFVVRSSRDDDETDWRSKSSADAGLHNEVINPEYSNKTWPVANTINDICFNDKGIFISEDGLVHPCCDWASRYKDKSISSDEIHEMYKDTEWHDLNLHSLKTIMQNPFWDRLWDSLYNGKKRCTACDKRCGVYDNKTHWDNIKLNIYEGVL